MLGDWQEKERKFHLEQALAKAELRVTSGRGDAFDWLIVNTAAAGSEIIRVFDDDPVKLLQEVEDVQPLIEALEGHRDLERDQESLDYLDALITYLHAEIETESSFESRSLKVVQDDIKALLGGKSVGDLLRLENSIKAKLAGPGPIDTEYWEGLLSHLDWYKRCAMVRESVRVLVDRRKGRLGEMAVCLTMEDWRTGGATPIVGPEDNIPPTPSPIEPTSANQLPWDTDPKAVALQLAESSTKPDKDEFPFNDIVEEDSEPSSLVLFKPRYSNRVRACYDWNKYNQAHYSSANPPPRTVQGYSFALFYPRLTSTSPAPTYQLVPDPEDPDRRLIRFKAGPPYQDLVFRIANEEWDMSHRQDFSSVYENGVLRLQFWFKSQRYKL